MMEWEEIEVCPEISHSETQEHMCEREMGHDGSHVYTVWHMESYSWAGIEHYEAVPDHPVYWDTELRCPENGLICPEPNGLFQVDTQAPDRATLNLLVHMHRVHGIGWLKALDAIQNEITAGKVVPA